MPEEELYDLDTDPHEIVNLADSDKPEHHRALKKLRTALAQWSEQTNDRGRLPDPDAAPSNTLPLAPAAQPIAP